MSKHEDSERVLSALSSARRGAAWWRAECPFCLDQGHRDRKFSLGVSVATGRFECFRCGTKGRLSEPLDPSATVAAPRPVGELTVLEPPEEYRPLWIARRSLSLQPARDYLAKRGVGDPGLWRQYQIGAAVDGFWDGRVIIPLLSPDEDDPKWLGWIGRLWHGPSPNAEGRNAMKYLNSKELPRSILWNHVEVVRKTREILLVVEGLFDALPHTPNVAAVLGKPTHAQVDALLSARRPLVIALDGDSWEEGHMLALKLRFSGLRAGAVRLPPKTDPNGVGPQELLRAAERSLDSTWDPIKV